MVLNLAGTPVTMVVITNIEEAANASSNMYIGITIHTLSPRMLFSIFNRRMNWVPRFIASTKDTHANANTCFHSPHCKARCPTQVQATFCCTVRGNIYSLSSHLDPNFHATIVITQQGCVSDVSGLLHSLRSKCWLCMRVSRAFFHWHRRAQCT